MAWTKLLMLPLLAAAFKDCDEVDVAGLGPYGDASQFNVTTENGTLIFVLHPALDAEKTFPVMVFSHGSTGEYAMYETAIKHYVSHGFVVVFPHIKGAKADTKPLTLDPHGGFTIHGFEYAMEANANATSPLYQKLDTQNVVLAGHSMGATSTLMAATKLPAGSAKVAVAQHPGLCGPWGPPPCLPGSCSTWMPADFEDAASKMPMLLTTATNDGAFWPAPYTAEHELGCFNKSTERRSAGGTAFAQFSEAACQDDGTGGRYDRKWSTGGHDCPMRQQSPETAWVLTAAKLYAQLGGNTSSKCYGLLWGTGNDSLKSKGDVEKSIINYPASRAHKEIVV